MKNLHDLKPTEGSHKKKKRMCRGHAGYGGKMGGKGMNGQKARTSAGIPAHFEGGQTPLYRRLPKKQFINAFNRKKYTLLSVGDLELFASLGYTVINAQILDDNNLVAKIDKSGVKILGDGEITAKITIEANGFSASAKEKLEKAGCTCTVIS